MTTHINLLTIPMANIKKEDLLNQINQHFQIGDASLFIVTANPEIIMLAQTSPKYKEAITAADYIVADGIGIMIAAKILKTPLAEKLPGFELMHDFLQYANTTDKKVYFYGAKPGIAEQAAKKAKMQYNNLQVAGYMDGYTIHGQDAADKIRATNPDFVFVAMGAPRQEEWIAEFKDQFPGTVLIGVGGSFDVLSGTIKRAPAFWTNNNLEWFYRLVTQPTRAKRMLKIPLFLMHVVRERLFRK